MPVARKSVLISHISVGLIKSITFVVNYGDIRPYALKQLLETIFSDRLGVLEIEYNFSEYIDVHSLVTVWHILKSIEEHSKRSKMR